MAYTGVAMAPRVSWPKRSKVKTAGSREDAEKLKRRGQGSKKEKKKKK